MTTARTPRQIITLTVEIDVEAQDWTQIVQPGVTYGPDDYDPPVDKREQVEGLFATLLTEALGEQGYLLRCTLKPQDGTVYDPDEHSDF